MFDSTDGVTTSGFEASCFWDPPGISMTIEVYMSPRLPTRQEWVYLKIEGKILKFDGLTTLTSKFSSSQLIGHIWTWNSTFSDINWGNKHEHCETAAGRTIEFDGRCFPPSYCRDSKFKWRILDNLQHFFDWWVYIPTVQNLRNNTQVSPQTHPVVWYIYIC